MNTRIKTLLACALICPAASAQTVQEVLRSVEERNLNLSSVRIELQAEKMEYRSEIIPDGPEVEFNYLWGTDSQMGDRHDLRITQTLDLATLTGMTARLASSKGEVLQQDYSAQRQQILLEAEEVCIELIYNNALHKELSSHLANAVKLVDAYSRKVELGGASVRELNNARLHCSTVRGQLQKVELERDNLLQHLKSLNGGEGISCSDSDYSQLGILIPENFEDYYDQAYGNSPVINGMKSLIDVKQRQLGVDKAAMLPGLTVGYMSEISLSEGYRGLTFGVAIPLWSNAARLRKSKLDYQAAKTRMDQTVQSMRNGWERVFRQAKGMGAIASGYRKSLELADNREYLLKAEEQGEISIIEYITEIDLFYDNLEQTLAAERDYHLALAELTSVYL